MYRPPQSQESTRASHIRQEFQTVAEICKHYEMMRWGLLKPTMCSSVLTQFGRMYEVVGLGGGVGFKSLWVYSMGGSAHWMAGDHSLGGVCMPHIPRLWHVCVSVCLCGGRCVCCQVDANKDRVAKEAVRGTMGLQTRCLGKKWRKWWRFVASRYFSISLNKLLEQGGYDS